MIAILRGDGETALREAQMEPDSFIDVLNSRSRTMRAGTVRRPTLHSPN